MAKHREKLVMNRTWRRDVLAASLIGLTVAACGPRPSLGQAASASRAWLDLETALRATSLEAARHSSSRRRRPTPRRDSSAPSCRGTWPYVSTRRVDGGASGVGQAARDHAGPGSRPLRPRPRWSQVARFPERRGRASGHPRLDQNPGRTDTTASLTDPAWNEPNTRPPRDRSLRLLRRSLRSRASSSGRRPRPVRVHQAAAPIYQIRAPLSQAPARLLLVVSPAPSPPILVNPPQQTRS